MHVLVLKWLEPPHDAPVQSCSNHHLEKVMRPSTSRFAERARWTREQLLRGDRRSAIRHPVTGTAKFSLQHDELHVHGDLMGISTAGAGILASTGTLQHLVGILGVLTITSPTLAAPITCYASLVRQVSTRSGQTALGMEFVSIDDDNLARIQGINKSPPRMLGGAG